MANEIVTNSLPSMQDIEHDRFCIAIRQAAETMSKPEYGDRLQKAMDLVLNGSVILHQDATATVKSGSHSYQIAPDCTCQDSQHRSRYCKHFLAVELSPFNIVTFCAVKSAMNASFSLWYGVHSGEFPLGFRGIVLGFGKFADAADPPGQ